MITIKFTEKPDYLRVEAKGHSLFEKKGKDVICASVSVLLQSWPVWEKELAGVDTRIESKNGYFNAIINGLNEKALLFFYALRLSLEILETQYPENIKILREG